MLLRKPLLWAAGSPEMRKVVEATPVMRPLVNRFIPAQNPDDLVPELRTMLEKDCRVTLDYLGEDTLDKAQAQRTVDAYLDVLSELAKMDIGNKIEVSVKLSAVGQALPDGGEETALENARKICEAAKAANTTVTLDMEDHTTTDSTLRIARELRKDYPWVGIVLQAYLKRTEEDCKEFASKSSRVRLCKGAYQEPETVAYQKKQDIDEAYQRCAKILLEGKGYPMLATHDPKMINGVKRLAKELGRDKSSWEFQMLYGIRPDEQENLAFEEYGMRVYMAYGDEWYGYFMRRLAEKPANVLLVARSLVSKK
ncbi:MAG: proline dehydrogenase family protein [Micrococcaceae bacterium]